MEPIDMSRAEGARPAEPHRGAAHRAVRPRQRARHRRAGAGRPDHRARREDRHVPDACGEQAGGDDPQLRGDPPRALRARRLAARPTSMPPIARRLARRALDARLQGLAQGRPRHADDGGSRLLEAGRHAAAERQDAHRPRRRAQAHPGHARARRDAAGRLHQPRHLLRRPGRPGARRGGRPGRPDHRHPHGQVHRHDAGADRPASP